MNLFVKCILLMLLLKTQLFILIRIRDSPGFLRAGQIFPSVPLYINETLLFLKNILTN